MAATTYSQFNANTEALEVAESFKDQIRNKTVLVTGVNRSGIGFTTSQAIASQSPALLVITGRNQSKLQECIDALKAEFPKAEFRTLQVDLSKQKSVRDAAAEALAWSDVPAIDIIINSAGVMGVQERTLTDDGVEMHFATNHIGHWLLTCLLLPKLIKAAESNPKGATRIVNVSSGSPTVSSMRWSDMRFEVKNKDLPEEEQPNYQYFKAWAYSDAENMAYVPLDGYSRSKVANVLFGIGAIKRWYDKYGIFATAVHPGVILTELGRNFPPETMDAINDMREKGVYSFKTLGAGASTTLVAALDPKLSAPAGDGKEASENRGSFLMDCQISDKAKPLAVSSKEADRLWQVSEELVGQKFS